MKFNNVSLTWKLFIYIFIFAIMVIMIFCVFQILLLEKVYSTIKENNINALTLEVNNLVQDQESEEIKNVNSDIYETLENISKDSESSIYIIGKKYFQYTPDGPEYEYYQIFPNENMKKAFVNNNNEYLDKIWDNVIKSPYNTKNPPMADDGSLTKSILSASLVELSDRNKYIIIVDSKLTPASSSVTTVKTQLVYITLLVLVLSIWIAVILSKSIANPIIKMNDTAKQLAKGRHNIVFDGEGYLEIYDLNESLNYAVAELKKTETLQRELMANVSHDLRTPLTLITGYAEMIRDLPSENTKENIQIIVDEANRLSMLVNDMMNLSKLSSRTEPLNYVKYNLTDSINDIVNRQQKFFQKDGFNIEFHYEQEVEIEADESKIEQVVYNFISNAINYSGNSRQIDIYQDIDSEYITISIQDYGIGIKTEDLKLIWERYYRVDKAHSRSNQGSGLGLAIIKGILDYHGYQYGVVSEKNKGSRFWFKIPIN